MLASGTAAVIDVDDPTLVERFARRDPALHLYELGDLDPFFWPHTRWYGLADAHGELSAVALLYTGASASVPTMLALARANDEAMPTLLRAVAPRLPDRVYTHLGPALLPCLGDRWRATHHGRHLKLRLPDDTTPSHPLAAEAVRLTPDDLPELLALYEQSYPGNWFDPRMLETGQYHGLRRDGVLACVAGIHVVSPRYRVAALGNVTTLPSLRGQGLAAAATARVCQSLRAAGIETIGLNVLADNAAAIACYRRLGFVESGEYDEYMLDPA